MKNEARLYLDPRTKLIILTLFSIIVMVDVSGGAAYILRIILTFIPVILVMIEGRTNLAISFSLSFVLASFLMKFTQGRIFGLFGMLILFFCYMILQFAPTIITVSYCISTTKISEFMKTMDKLRLPQGLIISLAVMMRFFPTIREEYSFIKDAMKMRGISLGKGNLLNMVNYRVVPILFSCLNIGDELLAAAVTRGLGSPIRRTCVYEIGFSAIDIFLIIGMSLLSIIYLFMTLNSGLVIL